MGNKTLAILAIVVLAGNTVQAQPNQRKATPGGGSMCSPAIEELECIKEATSEEVCVNPIFFKLEGEKCSGNKSKIVHGPGNHDICSEGDCDDCCYSRGIDAEDNGWCVKVDIYKCETVNTPVSIGCEVSIGIVTVTEQRTYNDPSCQETFWKQIPSGVRYLVDDCTDEET